MAVLDFSGAGGKFVDLRSKETCKYPRLGSVWLAVCVCVEREAVDPSVCCVAPSPPSGPAVGPSPIAPRFEQRWD